MKRFLLVIPLLLACAPFFYSAPPPLPKYPERIPTKNWTDLLAESSPALKTTPRELITEVQEFLPLTESLSQEEASKKVTSFIDRNRLGQFNIPLANFLLELQELVALDTPAEELLPYLEWRSQRIPPPQAPSPPTRQYDTSQAEFEADLESYRAKVQALLKIYDRRIEAASPRIKPFEMTRKAAFCFRAKSHDLAYEGFKEIVDQFPDHPRAEIARFMMGRCKLGRLRDLRPDDFEDPAKLEGVQRELTEDAQSAFRAYLDRYPKGRFANDAIGWLGGIARDQGFDREALNNQLRRLEIQPTREVQNAVLRECDEIFKEAFAAAARSSTPGPNVARAYLSFDYERMARHPMIARLFVFHALDPTIRNNGWRVDSNTSGDRSFLDFLHRRVIRPGASINAALLNLGRAVSRQPGLQQADSMLVLGWATTRQGYHAQALKLFDLGLQDKVTDELLHGKAVALSRLDLNAEAAQTYVELATRFPESPLVPPSKFDHAVCLFHSGQAGEALLIFDAVARETRWGPNVSEESQFRPTYEHSQWVDTIVQFGPLEEIKATFDRLEEDHPSRPLLRRTLSMRNLCLGNLAAAEEFIVEEEEKQPRWRRGRYDPSKFFDFTRERWEDDLRPLIKAKEELKNADLSSSNQARLHLRLGRLWQARRGRLTIPLQALTGETGSEPDRIDFFRSENARFVGLSEKEIRDALVSRDELAHALFHFQKAFSLTSEADIVAPALEGANEALFRLAEFTPYRNNLAVIENHQEKSRKWVARLRQEFPDRPESARAIAWTFVPTTLLGPWHPGDRAGYIADRLLAELFLETDEKTIVQGENLLNHLLSPRNFEPSLNDYKGAIEEASKKFDSLRPQLPQEVIFKMGGRLDDFQLLLSQPNLTADQFRTYAKFRLFKEQPAKATEPSAIAPFQDFLHEIRKENAPPDWKAYLISYPNGPKSEAVSLRRLRQQVRRVAPIPHVRAIFFPDAPRITGYKGVTIRGFLPPEEPTAEELLAQHLKAFPNGRYQADVDLLAAALEVSRKDFAPALARLTRILTDRSHPELAQNASLRFAEVALRLLKFEDRAAIKSALQKNPAALALIKKMAHGETCVARLRPMLPALEE